MAELLCKDEVYALVGAAMEVHTILGPGFLEAVYQEALELELENRKIPFVTQKALNICYKGSWLKKTYIADILAFDTVIIEIKALDSLTSHDEAQLLNYLKATGIEVGLLLNFDAPKLDWKRRVLTCRIPNSLDSRH